jgi:hypothetical protein
MEKQWIKGSNYKEYAFLVDGKKIGDMNIKFSQISHRAICTIGEKEFEIKRVGYWKSNFGMYFGITHTILTAIIDERYGNTFNIEFENKEYKLIIRNNPWVEYVITENGQDVLIYALKSENGEPKLIIYTSDKSNYYFDFLLWFLFLPIAG